MTRERFGSWTNKWQKRMKTIWRRNKRRLEGRKYDYKKERRTSTRSNKGRVEGTKDDWKEEQRTIRRRNKSRSEQGTIDDKKKNRWTIGRTRNDWRRNEGHGIYLAEIGIIAIGHHGEMFLIVFEMIQWIFSEKTHTERQLDQKLTRFPITDVHSTDNGLSKGSVGNDEFRKKYLFFP